MMRILSFVAVAFAGQAKENAEMRRGVWDVLTRSLQVGLEKTTDIESLAGELLSTMPEVCEILTGSSELGEGKKGCLKGLPSDAAKSWMDKFHADPLFAFEDPFLLTANWDDIVSEGGKTNTCFAPASK